jgi:hypothetical protein
MFFQPINEKTMPPFPCHATAKSHAVQKGRRTDSASRGDSRYAFKAIKPGLPTAEGEAAAVTVPRPHIAANAIQVRHPGPTRQPTVRRWNGHVRHEDSPGRRIYLCNGRQASTRRESGGVTHFAIGGT